MSVIKKDLGHLVAELGPTYRRHPKRITALAILFLAAIVFASGVLISWLNSIFGATGIALAGFFILTGLGTLLSMAIEAYDAEMIARQHEAHSARRESEWQTVKAARRRIPYGY